MTIGYWTDTEIILSATVNRGNGHSCNMNPGDKLDVSVRPDGNATKVLRGSAQVVFPTGAPPDEGSVSPDFGPDAGGTMTSDHGQVTVSGRNFSGAQAVWFGLDYAAPPIKVTSSTVTAVPPFIGLAMPVQVRVATLGGRWQPSKFCVLQNGCPGAYFFMEQSASWQGDSSFGPYTKTYTLKTPPGTNDKAKCGGEAKLDLTFTAGGSFTGSGQVLDDGAFPSAAVVTGSIGVPNFSLKVTVKSELSGKCDIPVPDVSIPPIGPVEAGLYIHVEGSITGEVSFTLNATNLALDLNGFGWVNGQLIGTATPKCAGHEVTGVSSLQPCFSISPPKTPRSPVSSSSVRY